MSRLSMGRANPSRSPSAGGEPSLRMWMAKLRRGRPDWLGPEPWNTKWWWVLTPSGVSRAEMSSHR